MTRRLGGAVDRLRRPRASALAAAAGVLVLVGLGTAVPGPDAPAVPTPEPVPVASAELLCSVTTATSALVSTVAAAVAPLPSVSEGVATLAPLMSTSGTSPSAPSVITEPGTTVTRVITDKPGPALLARATGSFATGLGADQSIRSGQGATRGLAAAPCARPVTEGWLVGGASTVGRITQVLLVNDDDRPAQVDLLVYGPEGPVAAPAGSGLVLPASSRLQVRLDTLAPNQAVTAVHVVARTGRIGFAGLDTAANGLIPLGMSLLPVTQAARDLVVADVPAPVASSRLLLLAPDSDTTVAVTLLTPDGPITPAGLDQIDLEAGKVTSVDLAEAQSGQPLGIALRADTPVVAGVEVGTGSGAQMKERDATAAGTPLVAPGVVVGLAGGNLKHRLALSSAAGAGRVDLALYVPGAAAPAWTDSVDVPEGSTRRVAIPVTTPTASSILVVTPSGGVPLYVTREITEAGARGPMLALAPVLPSRPSTVVPPVQDVPGSSVR